MSLKIKTCLLAILITALGQAYLLYGECDSDAEVQPSRIHGNVLAFGDYKAIEVDVFLFDWDQSDPLRKLLRETQKRLRSVGQGKPGAIDVEAEFYNKVADLVLGLHFTAKTKTDKAGTFEFRKVTPYKRYYVVALSVTEDGVFYALGSTPSVEPGEVLKIEVREINPWYANTN